MQNGIPVGLRSSPSFGLSRSGQLTAIIQSLFWDGSQGYWFDNNDTTTLFQDSAGTTPVTAVEQFVGLQLDKSKGLVLGPELVTNGTFDTNTTGWAANNAGATFTWQSGGFARFQNTSDFSFVRCTSPNAPSLPAGYYLATFNVISISTGGASIHIGPGTSGNSVSTAGQKTFLYRHAGGPMEVFQIRPNTAGLATIDIDNISVRELPGNHRYAPASGNRPIWSKRVNLLTKTEQFEDAAWTKTQSTAIANQATAPDGTNTADKLQDDSTASATHFTVQSQTTLAASYVFSVYAKKAERNHIMLYHVQSNVGAIFNLDTGVVTTPSGIPLATASATNAGSGWWRCTITLTATAASNSFRIYLASNSTTFTYTGDGTSGIYIWGADLRPANQATGLLPLYQRVNTSSDYDTNGFPGYLKADGVDDFLQTNSIDFNTVTSDGQARRNLLVNPTQFDASGWTKSDSTVAANAAVAPDGTTTAERLIPNISSNNGRVVQGFTGVIGTTYTASIYGKEDAFNNLRLYVDDNGSNTVSVSYNLTTGAVSTALNVIGGNWTGASTTITSVGSGWWRATLTFTATAVAPVRVAYWCRDVGDGTSGIFIWGAQLETGSTATAFQNIGTDKITLCAGVRKLSDAAQAVVTELSATIASNNGTFLLAAPDGATNTYGWDSKGTTQVDAVASTFTAPITNVVTGIGNISGDSAIIRVNGVVADTETGDQGTGNYGNYPVYFFHRNSPAGTRFTGYEYGNIAVGKLLTADQLTALETYMNGLTKAY